jgi:hypothetical protein
MLLVACKTGVKQLRPCVFSNINRGFINKRQVFDIDLQIISGKK